MSNDNDLLKQLQDLPNEAEAPERWGQIQQQIESDSQPEEGKRHRYWWTTAIAASALLVTAISSMFLYETDVVNTPLIVKTTEEPQQPQVSETYLLTIESLQRANASYYAKLGYMLNDSEQTVAPKTLASLKSLRQAQQQYRLALTEKPQSGRIQERLFWLYQKERQLLRHLVV
ncbi:hypothetical protein DZA50_00740 [Kangiella sp. HD9-110m-PIT-SAG07]|nr:hypothetical protein DZA50_00740 [Kangiella sp. HD9-110m-PIT-SAG07]